MSQMQALVIAHLLLIQSICYTCCHLPCDHCILVCNKPRAADAGGATHAGGSAAAAHGELLLPQAYGAVTQQLQAALKRVQQRTDVRKWLVEAH